MKNTRILFLFATLIIVGCNYSSRRLNSKFVEYTNNSDMNSIQSLLKKQLLAGAIAFSEDTNTDVPTGYIFTKEDILVISPTIKELLSKKGYTASDECFKERITEIFKYKSDSISRFNLLSDKFCDDVDYDIFQFKEEQLYIIPEYQIVILPYLLPELIDYQKIYPEISEIEEHVETTFEGRYGTTKLMRWKDMGDLYTERESNLTLLFHLNMFLVNNSRASLAWLINDHSKYLHVLVTKFGYDKELKINQLVLEDIYQKCNQKKENVYYNYSDCNNLLFSRGHSGDMRINHGILTTLKELTAKEDNRYLEMLGEYLISINSGTLESDLSDEEKIELYCLFGSMELEILKNYPRARVRNCAYISSYLTKYRHNYQEIAKKHNYWGIPNFGDIEIVSEWEYLIVNEGENKENFDYESLR